jgi:crotonobetainyl-CoA:carnitine CoA-transferase CaiB-like acyl-CoA transferase
MFQTTPQSEPFPKPEAVLAELLSIADVPLSAIDEVSIHGSDPVFPMPYRLGTAGAAALGAVGAAISAIWKLRTGRSQKAGIDVVAAAVAMRAVMYFQIDGTRPANHRDPLAGFYPVRDGRWIYLHVYFPAHRVAALKVLGAHDAQSAKRLSIEWDGEALEAAVHAAGGCAAFVRTREEWLETAQYKSLLNEAVLEIAQVGEAPPRALGAGDRPLSGVRVLDLTRVLAGPVSTRTLAEHGADVLRITADHLPNLGPLEYDYGVGKLSASLDIRNAADKSQLEALLETTDIFCQSYRPGALDRYGFSMDQVVAMRPGIVHVTLDAWGYTGPWADRRGYDSVVQSANGMVAAASTPDAPSFLGAMPMDYLAGYLMAYGAIVALRRQVLQGGSWSVKVSLARVGEWLMSLGIIPKIDYESLPAALDAQTIERLTTSHDSSIGSISQIKPILTLSETPPALIRPPVALGSQPAQWPI